jgi:hypothetical protein
MAPFRLASNSLLRASSVLFPCFPALFPLLRLGMLFPLLPCPEQDEAALDTDLIERERNRDGDYH